MACIGKDIERLQKVFDSTLDERWDKIFSESNEDLNKLLSHIDVKDKDVYSVLSSSDMLFHLHLNGAKTVDTFDINPHSYRYYFFRKWLLEKGVIDIKGIKKSKINEIYDIISGHSITDNIDEKESELFWEYYLDSRRKARYYSEMLFTFYNHQLFDNTYDYDELRYFCTSSDVKELSDKLNSMTLNFEQKDILSDTYVAPKRKYDIVYLSNIMDLDSSDRIKNGRNNVYKLLKDDGIVVCTNIRHHPYFNLFRGQQQIFSEYFEYEELFTGLRGTANHPIKYYIYKK